MRITLIALLWLAPATAVLARQSVEPDTTAAADVQAMDVLPPTDVPSYVRLRQILPYVYGEDLGNPSDSLSDAQILRRISRVYGYQAALLAAQSEGDDDLVQDMMDRSMTEMGELMQQPGIQGHPRFREMYRSVITEYERYYGVSADSLFLQYGDIYQMRDEMFTALNDVDEPLLEDVSLPDLTVPMETSIPMTVNRLVEQSIRYLLDRPERHLYHWLGRAETYLPMIEQILKEEGVPDELKYLAMIESGLNPRARSWARANGMWQFISATGHAYDLEIDSWVDERLDPEKSTRAAARLLKHLHDEFGDWHLALAGYNYSPGKLKRHIRHVEARLGRKATFWDVYRYLPRETRNYVPMYIATALVASNPEAFDVDLSAVQPGPRYAYDYVPVHGMLSTSDLADLAGTDVATIRALNPELRRSMIPPTNKAYYVRIPLDTHETFAENYARLPDSVKNTTVVEYRVRRGDVLGKIARRYGVSVSSLMRNNGLHGTTIRVGQRLIVPMSSYEGSPAFDTVDASQALAVEYGERSTRPIAANGPVREMTSGPKAPDNPPVVQANTKPVPVQPEEPKEQAEETTEPDTRIVYEVRRGDTLGKIAAKYHVSVRDVQRWNKLRGTRIRAGQRLHLYGTSEPEAPESGRVVYRVRRGDTLSEIAQRYGVSIRSIRQWNDLRGSRIRTGQRLTVYPSGTGGPTSHLVRRGDTLIDIARQYGVSVQELKKWNGLRSNTIRRGQTLKLKG